jgi:ribosome-binding protein aMBF1 (putative translation factor)
MTMLTVPAEMVGPLRGGLHSALGEAAQEIDNATLEASREVDPDLYADLLARFDRTRALLDKIGWTETIPAVPGRLDLTEHRAALVDTLDIALGTVDAEVAEARAVDAERAQRGEPSQAEQTIQRQRSLHEFATTVTAQADRLGGVGTPVKSDRELTGFGRTVRKLRQKRNISVGDLAAATRLTPVRLEAIEAGRLDPRFDVLLALSRGLGVSLSEITKHAEAEVSGGDR